MQERREWAVPQLQGQKDDTEGGVLFGKDDVQAQKTETNVQRLSMPQMGEMKNYPFLGNSFRAGSGNYGKGRGKGFATYPSGYQSHGGFKGKGRSAGFGGGFGSGFASWGGKASKYGRGRSWGKGMSPSSLFSQGGFIVQPRRLHFGQDVPTIGWSDPIDAQCVTLHHPTIPKGPELPPVVGGESPPRFKFDKVWGGAPIRPPPLVLKEIKKSSQEIQQALQVMREYVEIGATKEVEWEGTIYLLTWFVI